MRRLFLCGSISSVGFIIGVIFMFTTNDGTRMVPDIDSVVLVRASKMHVEEMEKRDQSASSEDFSEDPKQQDEAKDANKKKPNVMIIIADDVGSGDVPGYWDSSTRKVDMPNLEALLASGTTFTDAHSTPLCATSRYVLLSGNYQHRGTKAIGGVWALNHEWGSQFRDGQQSIAQVFRDNGYHTSMYGKWHIGAKVPIKTECFDPPKNWKQTMLTIPEHDWNERLVEGPGDIGFQESYMTTGGIQSTPYAFFRNDRFEDDTLENIKYWNEGNHPMPEGLSKILIDKEGQGSSTWDSTAYNMILVNETEDFLSRHLENNVDEPFFTYVALGAAHLPHSPPDKYLDGEDIAGQYPTDHMDILREMDKVVGSLIQILEEKDVIEDTIIVFASDNGGLGTNDTNDLEFGHLPSGPLREEKGSIYEGGHRIPMTIRWDNGMIPKGEKRPHMVGLNDLFATLTDLANITVPYGQASDSVSFAKYALDETNIQGLRQYLATFKFNSNVNQTDMGAIRMDNMKLVYDYKYSIVELYDLSSDISETTDLSADNADLVQHMLDELKKIGPCYDRQDEFEVYLPDQDSMVLKNCEWFKEEKNKINERCAKYHEGVINCGLTCSLDSKKGRCNRLSSIFGHNNNTKYNSWCKDNIEPFSTINGKGVNLVKDCTWVQLKNTELRCTFPNVREECPYACNFCQCSNNDLKFRIETQGFFQDKNKNCRWVNKKITNRCKLPEARLNCPKHCGECTE